MKTLAAFLFLAVTALAEPPPPPGKLTPLFDGKTLEHFEGSVLWKVVDGEIHGGSLTETVKHNDFLATKKSYSNFELRVKLRLNGTGFVNSGVQIRSLRVPGSSEMAGYQVDYGDGWYGKLYDESRRNKVIAESKDAAAVNAAIKKGEWNEYRIRAEGARIQSWVNGVAALDYTEADANIAQDGHIGIQIHGGGKAVVQVKDITIEELPPTKDAPTWEKVGRPGEKKPKPALKEGNAPGAGAKTPEEQRALFKVPDGLEVELVAAEIPEMGVGKFVAVYFDQKGAMWTMTALEYPVDGNENPAAAAALYASKAKDKILVYDRDPKSSTGFVSKPRVFADGLAIPLGILPYKDGCYAQHGPDIVFLRDTDGDGKADKREVILTGFGVQDSHLFPHQFTRAPGGWIWMAQGAFNYGKVSQPGKPERAQQFDQTRMAKFRPDGSDFTITSQGPCNIWGFVMNAEGESFIQEANDYGYPVMPFHEYANYPGCSDRQMKSYAPEFPGTAPDFKMGGTGLSGLALTDKDGIYPTAWRDVMLVANPITSRINAIKMHRDGPRWRLEKLPDFVETSDPWFRPVAMTLGPDGCVYIVDWYNKIISHNEVPRAHPDRDKTRGRIWRVKPKAGAPFAVPDFTKLSGDELVAKLGGPSLAQSHLAWQTITDRWEQWSVQDEEHPLGLKLAEIAQDEKQSIARRVQAIWASKGAPGYFEECLKARNRNLRREAIIAIGEWQGELLSEDVVDWFHIGANDQDPEVRAEVIRMLGRRIGGDLNANVDELNAAVTLVVRLGKAPLAEPMGKSTQSGKPIKVREAYEREFERYLVRMFLERHPEAVARFLDTDDAKKLPVEARLLASLALEPKASAPRVAALLPQLTRPPEREEILRLVQFLDEPGVAGAVRATLANAATAPAVLNALLELRSKLDPAKLAPLVTDAATKLLASKDAAQIETGVKLAGAFQLKSTEAALVALLQSRAGLKPAPTATNTQGSPSASGTPGAGFKPALLSALASLGTNQTGLFAEIAIGDPDFAMRDAALGALASSKTADAPQKTLALYPKLAPAQRRTALDKLTTTKAGANSVVAAVTAGTLAKTELDAATLDRLLAVLGDKDPALNSLVESLGTLFRPVLALDGTDNAFAETGLTLEGPFTVETWVKLDPGITNTDGILGAAGLLDLNFSDGNFRVWAGPALHDVAIAKKKTVPDMWTHVAATRDAAGIWKLYIDGELSATGTKPAAHKIENAKLGWTGATGGTKGQLAEFRIWKGERTAAEIRGNFDRGIAATANTPYLLLSGWGKLSPGARIVRTTDLPPVLTADAATKHDADFAKYTALAAKPGDKERGKTAALVCQACHLFGTTGGQIGPNLSGVGAMGTEAILRNILTPNAAMESAYRIYRVEQRDGSVLDAFYVSEDKDAVIIRLPGAPDSRIAKKDIVRTSYLRRSLMPEGLLAGMSDQQVSDLFAYLLSLK